MELTENTLIRNTKNEDIGRIDRVVLNPKTREVTALVIRKGIFFTHDKVVPVQMIDSSDENGIVLRAEAGDLDQLPDYQATYYVPAEEEDNQRPATDTVATPTGIVNTTTTATPSLFAYPPVGMQWGGGSSLNGGPLGEMPDPTMVRKTQINIPPDEVALQVGAHVLSNDGKHIGDVDEVITDSDARRMTHFVLSQGLLFKTRKLIPLDWVRSVNADEVRLAIGPQTLDQLRDYESAQGPEVPIF